MQNPNPTRAILTILGPGDAPPGRFVTPEGGAAPPRWEGAEAWATRHGPAQCAWRRGKPSSARNILMPNGARGNAQYTIFGPNRGWRRPVGKTDPKAEGWIFGTVQLSDRDAVFIDEAMQPLPVPPVGWGYPDLECDLWASAEIGAESRDQRFAMALYRTLEHQTWRYALGGLWQCTSRAAGAIAANLRGRGENYHDYYWRETVAPAAHIKAKLETALSRLGWHTIPHHQFEAIEAGAKTRLAEWEARPERPRPAWYLEDQAPQNAVASTRAGSLIQRIHRLAASDRISQEEWRSIFALLHSDG